MSRVVSWSEVEVHDGSRKSGKSSWTVIYDQVYDITPLIKIHPGGDIIRLGAGKDSTTFYESHHSATQLRVAEKWLKKHTVHIGTIEGSTGKKPDDAFFRTCRDRVDSLLSSRGWTRHQFESWAWLEMILTLVAFFVLAYFKTTKASIVAAALGGLVTGRIGFLMHSGNHGSLSRRAWGNKILGMSMYLAGGSHTVWRNEHQIAHHLEPNVANSDNDCTIGSPLLRFHPDVPQRWWHRLQQFTTCMCKLC